jgi:hypothetical protein
MGHDLRGHDRGFRSVVAVAHLVSSFESCSRDINATFALGW